jgi:anti-anti-sigma factor
MNATAKCFEVEIDRDTVIITPQADLPELDWEEIGAASDEVLRIMNRRAIRNVVVDLGKTVYFGSTALGAFANWWLEARARSGQMVLCNVSPDIWEVLETAGMALLWPISSSREEALASVRG